MSLTDEELDRIIAEQWGNPLVPYAAHRAFARAVELAAVRAFWQRHTQSNVDRMSIEDMHADAEAQEQAAWQPIETAPKDMAARLYLTDGCCVQGFVDATGRLMVQNEAFPHWRLMRGKPTHWMPLPAAPSQE